MQVPIIKNQNHKRLLQDSDVGFQLWQIRYDIYNSAYDQSIVLYWKYYNIQRHLMSILFGKMWGVKDIEKGIFPYKWFDNKEKLQYKPFAIII